ncbi:MULTISPECIES: winged helix-turn-helix domain-containing protein [Tenacibaculum]|uniref:winged helix-turn-helix domain-containing protein n=1 Tax=Tenacibaculum TaxID=104267 RepID=UPI001F22DE79|nr:MULTISPECIES: LysR family transcriptional regulator [Tenacibaculum]MCF2875846.1 LysR family transcriptional regulator [Tenacibaculum sp. Cn5-1]MCF2935921.1 LysR family transcriptional regulator [Tenacibaculum sp. Cn5-34]MCG7512482.1 LysR family transcriptional regulator [Tenacibaculum sp. Cn5-46]
MIYKIKSRIWIEADNKMFLGEGRIKLLKSIHRTNSISKSAKELGMSYKKAWNLIDSVNKSNHKPIVIKSTGGSKGGGTKLTPYGKKMIDIFDTINMNCWKYLDKQLKKLHEID